MSAETDKALEAPLQFDHVVHTDPSAAPRMECAGCGRAIVDSYYHDGGRTLCASCGATRKAEAIPDRGIAALLRASAFGLGAAIAGGIVYWAVMEYLDLQIGIVAIAIGFLVGRAVAKATRGRSARRHRILAVALTYLSVAIAYAPFAIKGIKEDKTAASADSTAVAAVKPDSAGVAASAPASAEKSTTSDDPAPAAAKVDSASDSSEPMTPGRFAIGLLALLGMLIALPVMASLMSMPGGLISILIIGFGLKQAWNVSAASNADVAGPFPVGSTAS